MTAKTAMTHFDVAGGKAIVAGGPCGLNRGSAEALLEPDTVVLTFRIGQRMGATGFGQGRKESR